MADNTEIKIDLESLRKDIENVNTIHNRIDIAIDKLTDVSKSILNDIKSKDIKEA